MMIELLNTKVFDNERNVLNADLFVSNLKHVLSSFRFNTKITYEVYRNVTIYHISWNDDKDYNDILGLRKEIALALGVDVHELDIVKINDNEIKIRVQNMKKSTLSLKELLEEVHDEDNNLIPLGLSEDDKVIYFDVDRDKNLLVVGVTGTGKSNLFNSIILNMLMKRDGTRIVILDSQSINYNSYSDVVEVVNDEDEIINKLKSIRREFEERIVNGNRDRIVIFIDEIYEIIKNDISVKDDINYLLEVGSSMNIHIIMSTDSVLDEDISYLFDKDDISKLCFYLTSRNEYNRFLDEYVDESLGKDAIYISFGGKRERVCIPLVDDDEIKRVVDYLKNNQDYI